MRSSDKELGTREENYRFVQGKSVHTTLSLRFECHPPDNCAGTGAIEVAVVLKMRNTAMVERCDAVNLGLEFGSQFFARASAFFFVMETKVP